MKKVNFWQILGGLLIIVGVVLFFRDKTGKDDVVKQPGKGTPPPAATEPSTQPTAEPPTQPAPAS